MFSASCRPQTASWHLLRLTLNSKKFRKKKRNPRRAAFCARRRGIGRCGPAPQALRGRRDTSGAVGGGAAGCQGAGLEFGQHGTLTCERRRRQVHILWPARGHGGQFMLGRGPRRVWRRLGSAADAVALLEDLLIAAALAPRDVEAAVLHSWPDARFISGANQDGRHVGYDQHAPQ